MVTWPDSNSTRSQRPPEGSDTAELEVPKSIAQTADTGVSGACATAQSKGSDFRPDSQSRTLMRTTQRTDQERTRPFLFKVAQSALNHLRPKECRPRGWPYRARATDPGQEESLAAKEGRLDLANVLSLEVHVEGHGDPTALVDPQGLAMVRRHGEQQLMFKLGNLGPRCPGGQAPQQRPTAT